MKTQKHSINHSELDQLLENTQFLTVPEGFGQRVMQEIDALPEISPLPEKEINPWWQWLALLGVSIPGITQVFSFIFSAWQLASAG